jgi:hypothetical protein
MALVKKSELKKKVTKMADVTDFVKDRTVQANNELESALDEYAMIKLDMNRLFAKFKEIGFETIVCKQDMPYDDDTVLTETNITIYLQEIEELISYMITYLAVRMNEPNASLAAVAVKNLPEKSFDRRMRGVK